MKGDVTIAGSRRKSGRFLLNTMVGCQVALSMILLISCGLLLRALYYAQTVDPGFEMKGIATIFLNLDKEGYDPAQATQFMTQFRERLSRVRVPPALRFRYPRWAIRQTSASEHDKCIVGFATTYSWRMSSDGSTLSAFLAGTVTAKMVISVIVSSTPIRTSGSRGFA
jgi:hypothetical protein